jgi:hypothetical protein
MIGVLEDSCERLACLRSRRGYSWGDQTLRSLGRGARGGVNVRRYF